MNNFIYTLMNYIKRLDLEHSLEIGAHPPGASIAITPLEGSEVIDRYMNGMADVRLPFEISVKTENKVEAQKTLIDLIAHLGDLGNYLKNEEKTIVFNELELDQLPVFKEHAHGFYHYHIKLTVKLTLG